MTTHNEALALLQREFPHYPADTLPDMSDVPWLEAQFWHHDSCPVWAINAMNGDVIIGFIANWPDRALREFGVEAPRYEAWWGENNDLIVSTDDITVAKAALHKAALTDRRIVTSENA